MIDYEEHLKGSLTVVFAFASARGDYGDVPRYEFSGTLARMGVDHVLMKDEIEGYYQDGVRGIGGIDDVVDYMRRIAARYDRTIAFGLSSGAYGALMFGQLAPTHEVIAVSPVSGLGPDVHPDFDPAWHYRVYHAPEKRPIRDLKAIYAGGPRARVRAFVSDGTGCELDEVMARRIGIEDVTVIPGADHAGLGRRMRDMGLLAELIR